MSEEGKVFEVFYSKDVRKKKKVYSQGILVCQGKKTRLFSSDGDCLVSLNSRSDPMPDDEYSINNNYVVVVDKQGSFAAFSSGKIFIQKQVPNMLPAVKKPKQKASGSLHKLQLQFSATFENGLQIQSFIYPQLREHQVEGVKFMYECLTGQRGPKIRGCILADFMGLGKTLQTLTLIRCLLIKKHVTKVLVICPLTLVRVWDKECGKWMGSKLTPLVAMGTAQDVAKAIRMFTNYEYRLLVASYEHYYKNSDSLGAKADLMVFDEGHRLKNKKSKLYKKIQTAKCQKRVLLTGTPIQNNLNQLHTCISLVNPSFFESDQVFNNVFHKPIISGMAKTASKELRALALARTSELANLIKQFSLRRKAEVLENYLPKKRQYQIFLGLSQLQLSLYQRILKRKINDSQVLSYLNQMRKLFTHPLLFKADRFDTNNWKDCWEDCRTEKSYKMEFVRQVALQCHEQKQKLVIVSYFTETLDFIQLMLTEENVTSSKLDGRLEGRERYNAIQSFAKQKTVLLLSGKAGGTGLTLTCASKMILMEADWNPSNDSQVMGRVWRQGQQKEVDIYRLLIASSFEERILQRQQLKLFLSQRLIDEQTSSKSYDLFSLKQLFLEIQPKCISYPSNSNKLKQCQQILPHLDWSHCLHVHIIESHQGQTHQSNEFEEAEFGDQKEEETDNEETNQEEDLQALDYVYQEEQESKPQKARPKFVKKMQLEVIEEKKEEKEHKESVKKDDCHEEEPKEENQCTQSTETVSEQKVAPDVFLPLALRKLKQRPEKPRQ